MLLPCAGAHLRVALAFESVSGFQASLRLEPADRHCGCGPGPAKLAEGASSFWIIPSPRQIETVTGAISLYQAVPELHHAKS